MTKQKIIVGIILFIGLLGITYGIYTRTDIYIENQAKDEINELSGMIQDNGDLWNQLEKQQQELQKSNQMLRVKKAGLENYLKPVFIKDQGSQ